MNVRPYQAESGLADGVSRASPSAYLSLAPGKRTQRAPGLRARLPGLVGRLIAAEQCFVIASIRHSLSSSTSSIQTAPYPATIRAMGPGKRVGIVWQICGPHTTAPSLGSISRTLPWVSAVQTAPSPTATVDAGPAPGTVWTRFVFGSIA